MLDTTSTVTDIAGGNAVGTDTLINIERVRGSSQADTFTANAGFSGQYGTQNFFEGMGGNDTITGNGHTVVQYTQALAAVTASLAHRHRAIDSRRRSPASASTPSWAE